MTTSILIPRSQIQVSCFYSYAAYESTQTIVCGSHTVFAVMQGLPNFVR